MGENKNIGIWFAVNKDNKLFLFTSEPKRVGDGWFGDLKVHYIGRDDFIANKRALGRKKDMADLEAVGVD